MGEEALTVLSIAHHCPGRVRLKLGAGFDNPLFWQLIAGLRDLDGVTGVLGRPATGSIILTYQGGFPDIAAAAAERKLCRFEQGEPNPLGLGLLAAVPPATIAAAAIAALGAAQLVRGRALPPAATLFWYAASVAGLVRDGTRRKTAPD